MNGSTSVRRCRSASSFWCSPSRLPRRCGDDEQLLRSRTQRSAGLEFTRCPHPCDGVIIAVATRGGDSTTDQYQPLMGTCAPRQAFFGAPVINVNTHIRVNNTSHELSLDSRLTLLDTLRDVLGLTGTKKGAITAHAARARSSSMDSV